MKEKDATLNHLFPQVKGGSDHDSNLVCTCEVCNKMKSDKEVDEFAFYIHGLPGLLKEDMRYKLLMKHFDVILKEKPIAFSKEFTEYIETKGMTFIQKCQYYRDKI